MQNSQRADLRGHGLSHCDAQEDLSSVRSIYMTLREIPGHRRQITQVDVTSLTICSGVCFFPLAVIRSSHTNLFEPYSY